MLPSRCDHPPREASPCVQRPLPDTLLSQYFSTNSNSWCKIQSKDITASLQQAVIVLNPTMLGFEIKVIEARCLQSGGAMALLCGNVDTNKIRF